MAVVMNSKVKLKSQRRRLSYKMHSISHLLRVGQNPR